MKPHEHVILEIARERERHISVEGWTPEHDDEHKGGELALAAACYAKQSAENYGFADYTHEWWPWDQDWWKPKDPRRDLVRAAALIVAEIERLDRAAANG